MQSFKPQRDPVRTQTGSETLLAEKQKPINLKYRALLPFMNLEAEKA